MEVEDELVYGLASTAFYGGGSRGMSVGELVYAMRIIGTRLVPFQ